MLQIAVVALQAEAISGQQAMDRARQFVLDKKKGSISPTLRRVPLAAELQAVDPARGSLYAFNVDGGGFVIVSGDDRTLPVLGYSLTGSLDPDDMPVNMSSWLQSYADEIGALGKWNVPVPQLTTTSLSAIEPLLRTTWYQVEPYNLMTPVYNGEKKEDWKGLHSATGCVATAMAQVMYYHRWPQEATTVIPSYTFNFTKSEPCTPSPLPATTFQWNKMLLDYSEEAPGTEEQRMAVAELMRYCGQAVKMDYTPDQSGSQHEFIVNAMRRYFGYSQAMYSAYRADYTISGWQELIWDELHQQRPVIFAGQSSAGGHEFVIDGYDGSGMFHVNWGWGGRNDGYFAINVLNPYDNTSVGAAASTDLGFATNQQIVVGLEKSTGMETPESEVVRALSIYNELISLENMMAYQAAYADFDCRPASYYMGLGLKNTDNSVTPVVQNDTTVLFAFNGQVEFTFFKTDRLSLADGTYHLYPIARIADDANARWEPLIGTRQHFTVEVVDGVATVSRAMNLKIISASFANPDVAPAENDTLHLVIENQGTEEVSTVTKMRAGIISGGKIQSALDIKTTLRPTQLQPGERVTLSYPITAPFKGDLDVELVDFSEVVVLDRTAVPITRVPHYFDLQVTDYKIEYIDDSSLEAVFYITNNDERTWQQPFTIGIKGTMEGSTSPVIIWMKDTIPTGKTMIVDAKDMEFLLYTAEPGEQGDVHISIVPNYSFFDGPSLLEVDVKMGTTVTPQGTTGIAVLQRDEDADSDAPYYDLQGRRLPAKPRERGIYISRGRKVIIQ